MSEPIHKLARAALCCLVLGALPAPASAGKTTGAVDSSATLPLEEVIELVRAREEAKQKDAPPVDAALQRMELRGRVLDDALELEARFIVDVLAEDAWVRVPVLGVAPGLRVTELPELDEAAFVVDEQGVALLARKARRYRFTIGLSAAARVEGDQRSVELPEGGAALTTCHLDVDTGLFELLGPARAVPGEGLAIAASQGRFAIRWRALEPLAKTESHARPPIDPVIPRALVSSVSTLEGRRITRVLYQLRFAGRESIAIDLPEGPSLERVFLNGVPVEVAPDGRRLGLEVTPRRAGDESGDLELVLLEPAVPFDLKGSLRLVLPRASWPVHELDAALSLPPVFDYTWSGGSLEPSESSASMRFSYQIPVPGRTLHFHQLLISRSAPDVALDYSVRLGGQYFRDPSQGR